MSVGFDARRLEVTGAPTAESVVPNVATFSASSTGVLAFRTSPPGATESQLLSVRSGGSRSVSLGRSPPMAMSNLSPDGKLVVVDYLGSRGYDHLWSADPARGVFSRVSPGESQDYSGGGVSPDGHVAFTDTPSGSAGDIYVRLASGAGAADSLVKSATLKHPNHWSLDGRFLVYDDHTAQKMDLWVVPMAGDRKPVPFLATPADETDAELLARYPVDRIQLRRVWPARSLRAGFRARPCSGSRRREMANLHRGWREASLAARRQGDVLHRQRWQADGRAREVERDNIRGWSGRPVVRDPHERLCAIRRRAGRSVPDQHRDRGGHGELRAHHRGAQLDCGPEEIRRR